MDLEAQLLEEEESLLFDPRVIVAFENVHCQKLGRDVVRFVRYMCADILLGNNIECLKLRQGYDLLRSVILDSVQRCRKLRLGNKRFCLKIVYDHSVTECNIGASHFIHVFLRDKKLRSRNKKKKQNEKIANLRITRKKGGDKETVILVDRDGT